MKNIIKNIYKFLKEHEFLKKGFILASLVLIFWGITYISYTWDTSKTAREEQVSIRAKTIEISLNGEMIKKLLAIAEGEEKLAYNSIRNRLINIEKQYKDADFVYIYTLVDGNINFVVDSGPSKANKDFLQGQKYIDAGAAYKKPFEDGKAIITQTAADSSEKWISVLVPIKSHDTGKIVAVLGMNYPAETFLSLAKINTIKSVIIVFFVLISLFTLYIIFIKNKQLKTEQVKRIIADEEIRNSEEQYRLLVTQMQMGLSLHEIICDDDGNPIDYSFISVNDEYEQLTGLRAKDIIGTTVLQVLPKTETFWIETYGRVALTGKSERFESYYVELDKYYSVVAYSPKYGQFAVIIDDITEKKKLDRELREKELYLRTILETTQDGFLVVCDKGRITDANEAVCKMSGYNKNELLMMNIRDLEVHEDPQEFKNRVKLISEYGSELFESRYLKKDGTFCDVEISITCVDRDKDLMVCFTRDITNRKQADKKIKEQNALLHGLFENMLSGVAVYEVKNQGLIGRDYIIREFNRTSLQLEGITRDAVIGKSLFDLRPNIDEYGIIPILKQVWLTGEPAFFPQKLYKDEGYENWYENRVFKLPTGEIVTMYDDVTQRIQMEKQIFNEKEQFKTTLMSVGDGVISTNDRCTVKILNKVAEQLTGWTQEDAEGRQLGEVFNIVNEFTRERCENPVYKVLETGGIVELANNAVLISKDGTERPIEDIAAPIMGDDGNIIGSVLVFRDFTEKKEKQAKIEYLNYHDYLTGLYNRRFYEEELNRLDMKVNLPLTILMGDVNGLKLINDSFGHSTGDLLLKKAAEVINKACRGSDIIARTGGDEFIVLLPKTDSFQTEKIIKRIKNLLLQEKVASLDVSISFGHATKSNEDEKIQDLLKRAEDYMYSNKLYESPNMREKTIDIIIKTLHEKNKREEQHSHRVSKLCQNMGEVLGMSQYKINELKTVGLLHDIGKIAINESILNKADKLTDIEWEEIKRHSEIGYRIISTVNEMSKMAEFVLSHHERWDGTGYPRALKGEEIPIESRIIAIVDAYDAMVTERPYRSALNAEAAMSELKKNSGTQFDPIMVNVFIDKVWKIENNGHK